MRRPAWISLALLLACECHAPPETAAPQAAAPQAAKPQAAAPQAIPIGPAAPAYEAEIAGLVVADLASNAFGNQKLATDCVRVGALSKAGATSVVSARLGPGCGKEDFLAEMLWVFNREDGAQAWSEEFLGPAPQCWRGVPPEIIDAVVETTGVQPCGPTLPDG